MRKLIASFYSTMKVIFILTYHTLLLKKRNEVMKKSNGVIQGRPVVKLHDQRFVMGQRFAPDLAF